MAEQIGAFKYTDHACPDNYECGYCCVHGVKLWRKSHTFLDRQFLYCAKCALLNQGKQGPVDEDGRIFSEVFQSNTDQIGDLVPAVPTEDGETFWGYTSVPDAGVK